MNFYGNVKAVFMIEKSTQQLQEELTSAADLNLFLAENKNVFNQANFAEQLQVLFQKSGLTKAALAKRAGTSEIYLYQIFSGDRTPSRDRTLCLCFGLGASLEEAQNLLKHSGMAELYVRDRRDAIIMFGLANKMALETVNDKLFSENEATLC